MGIGIHWTQDQYAKFFRTSGKQIRKIFKEFGFLEALHLESITKFLRFIKQSAYRSTQSSMIQVYAYQKASY